MFYRLIEWRMMRIDSHHHLWRFQARDYPWITERMEVLRRDYLPADLKQNLNQTGIDGTVVVQARQSVAETEWLLDLAATHDFIRGVVGWVPLIDDRVENILERFAADSKLKGIRHVLHDEADDGYMLRADFNRGVASLRRFGLVYDVLIFPHHLKNTLTFVDRHPNQPFVIDHIAKPAIVSDLFDQYWASQIRALAERRHVSCKVSGIVTEVRDALWNPDMIKPYFNTVLEAFGPDRLMFGTDWPVCLLRCSYAEWVDAVRALTAPLSSHEQESIWGGTAARVYGL